MYKKNINLIKTQLTFLSTKEKLNSYVGFLLIFVLLQRQVRHTTFRCIFVSQFSLLYKVLISVKKELNRLYILGTLITWFASYLAKSSQILKNHSIMLFTSNVNSL